MVHVVLVAVLFVQRSSQKTPSAQETPSSVAVSFVAAQEPAASLPTEEIPGSDSDAVATESHRPPIVPSTNRIVRESPPAGLSSPSVEEIANELLGALTPVTSVQNPLNAQDAAILQNAFYAVWQPPLRHEVGDANVVVRVFLGVGGIVKQVRVETPSGIPRLDASVRAAIQNVSKVEGLSDATIQRENGVTIAFSVIE